METNVLNTDAAGFITGICLPVDGGFSAYSGVQDPVNACPDRFRLPGQAEKASSPMSAPSRCRHGTFSYPKCIHRWQDAAHWTLYQKGAFRANSHRYEWSFDRACGILGLVQQLGI